MNGCCYGVITENYGIAFPAVNMPPAYLQQLRDGLISAGSTCTLTVVPTQIYSSLYGFMIFFLLLRIKSISNMTDLLFYPFLILFSASRFTIEFFRFYENRIMVFNLLTITQVICITVFLSAFIFMNVFKEKKANKNYIEKKIL